MAAARGDQVVEQATERLSRVRGAEKGLGLRGPAVEPPDEDGLQQRTDAGTCTLSSAANIKPRTAASADLVRGSSVVAAPVRGRPRKADGPVRRSQAPIPVRHASVASAT